VHNPTVLFIDAVASGFSVEAAAQLADLDIKEASAILEEQRETIDLRRQEIEEDSKIKLPSHRWHLLNEAAKMGVDGYYVATKEGLTRLTYNPALAISAVKVANEMQMTVSVKTDTMNISQTVKEMYDDLTKDKMYENQQAWELIKEALPLYTGIISQIQNTYERKGTRN